MDRLLEFTTNHPFLMSAAAFLTAMLILTETRRAKGLSDIGPSQAVQFMNQGAVVLDIREQQDFKNGHVLNAKNVPLSTLEGSIDKIKKYKDKTVIICCDAGLQSAKASSILSKMGFTNIAKLRGGLRAWREENLPVVKG